MQSDEYNKADEPGSEGGGRKMWQVKHKVVGGDRCSQGCDTPARKMVSANPR